MADYWLENAAEPAKHLLVDLGYVNCKDSRDRADRLFRFGIAKRNMQLVANGRVLIRIPPSKAKAVFRTFRGIRPAAKAPGYTWCTHTWLTKESQALKHAR